jgi:uncharacterized protein YbjT (DUF2867 family)
MKTAIVVGATGLTGSCVLNELLNNPEYGSIIVAARKSFARNNPKLKLKIIEFDKLPGELTGLKANDAFCCLGTTLKKAGSKDAQFSIDHDYVVAFAKACALAGVEKFAVVSSIGANKDSGNFYLKTKGLMEFDIKGMSFKALHIFQPSFLSGDRKEYRLSEKIGGFLIRIFNPLLIGKMKKYRSIQASAVARAMVKQVNTDLFGVNVYTSDQIQLLSK